MADAEGDGQRVDPAEALARAIAALASGDAGAAVLAASDACHAAPGDKRAHYAYGQAWLAAGDAGRAGQAFAAAVQLDPTWADAWVNYGVARYREGSVEDAKRAMRHALRHDPSHAGATANLGAFLRLTGDVDAAEALLRATLARAPDNVAARLNLVADLLQQERPADALKLLRAQRLPAHNAAALRHWRLQEALALLHLGRPAEARGVLAALDAQGPMPPSVAPLRHWRGVLLAMAEGDVAGAARMAATMAAALEAMGPDAVAEHRIMGHYDLAKFWSGLGAHDRAFAHWSAGHALLRPTQPFSRAEHAAFVDACIEAFSADRLSAGPRAGNDDRTPVFIVGMPRSGTTLCEQILSAHRDVHGAGERAALAQAFHALGGGEDAAAARRIAALDAATLDAAAAAYLSALRALSPGRARVVDKMPGNYAYLGLVGLLMPAARIIQCVRDPRDIGLSIFTFRFHGHHPYAHDLGDLGWTIAQQLRLMAHWTAVLPGRVLTVRLSDWVEDFDATLASVLDHIGLPPDPACARFHEQERRVRTVSHAQVRQPVNARGLGRWRAYAEPLAPLIAELEAGGALDGWERPEAD
ncbi:tetratricopeptide repeat-containing sulfotransferase family protein [Acidisphaera rubrifaciens]|uniref:Uncharacterized protein n=1 Tax=Acidisphaera rubrifaciens HS-AP3 TaxID=1231350 RepID=A0A0D6P648_9PROT|nr:sulfotransferase family protein [Acidisphaera rubrifaciens]GAN77235.1 hypothetical protein Asru_0260_01 [Acidisphaera rubrifaciens HS-AP3]